MKKILINDNWKYVKSAENCQEAVIKDGETITIPHTWNAIDGQDGGNDYYRGKCWYLKKFTTPKLESNGEVWVEFNAVAMSATVYLNGKKLDTHNGGFSIFRVNITNELNSFDEENTLVVAVSNEKNEIVYPQKADFTFYGGIYRDVYLITTSESYFDLSYWGGSGFKVTPILSDDYKSADVTVETWVKGSAETVTLTVDNQSIVSQIEKGYAKHIFKIEYPRLWNGKLDPYLYEAKAEISGDKIKAKFGCRKFDWDINKGFFLNGKSYPLCGAARHQDREGVGNAVTKAMMKEDLDIMLEMGVNTIRLAHYQHDQYFYDLCDEYGIITWVEIPYITEHMPTARENTLTQMKELVVQSYNHTSIGCWGLSNEITVAGGRGEDMLENHRLLNDICHKYDKTRPTVMAHAYMLEPSDPLVAIPDISSYNLYYGWYLGRVEDNDLWFDDFHRDYPNITAGLSEYGADANPSYHNSNPQKSDFTEEYQALYHEHLLKMWKERPYIWAMHCWNMFDFGADGRSEGGKPGQNQKGLVTFDRKLKKDAFYAYKAYLSEDAFLHICGRRYVDRPEDITEVKVYSNQNTVTLYLDDKEIETINGDKVFNFKINISGDHKITAISGDLKDEIIVKKVKKPNPEYSVLQGDVLNWFDKPEEMIKDGYYSIFDSVANIKTSEKAKVVFEDAMVIARASFGDVAQKVVVPPSVQKIQDAASFESMLKLASKAFTADMIKEINHKLNQIKK